MRWTMVNYWKATPTRRSGNTGRLRWTRMVSTAGLERITDWWMQVEYDKPDKLKIATTGFGRQTRYYIYVPYIYEVMKSEDTDPFFDALSSYKFKSNDENERMEILLGTPYEAWLAPRPEKKTCIPWVSKKVVLKPSLERKFIYKQGQVIKAAANMINIHTSEVKLWWRDSDEQFWSYANLYHQKNRMMNPQLQNVHNPSFCGALQILLQIFVNKTGTRNANAASGGARYERQNFPRELADEGYIDQMKHKYQKRSRDEPVPSNPRNVVPKTIPIDFSNC